MADLLGLLLLPLVGIVHYTQGLMPGLRGAHESQSVDVIFGAADTVKSATFNLSAPFKAAPNVTASARKKSSTGSPAAADIKRVEPTTHTKDQVVVDVELTAAPGGGNTRTVAVFLQAAGDVDR